MSTTAATNARTAQNAQARADRVEDINFMLETGVSNEAEVARRLGLTLASFERWCYRTGNAELWGRLIVETITTLHRAGATLHEVLEYTGYDDRQVFYNRLHRRGRLDLYSMLTGAAA